MKKKWNAGKIAGVTAGAAAAALILIISFTVGVYQFSERVFSISMRMEENREKERQKKAEAEPQQTAPPDSDSNNENKSHEYSYPEDGRPEEKTPDSPEEPDSLEEEYYSFGDALRDDLSYQVVFRNFDYVHPENDKIKIEFVYPLVEGEDIPNKEGINSAIQKEMNIIAEYIEPMNGYLAQEETYQFEGTGYVTYMDENILSVAYVEYSYMNGEYYESYVVPVNIDMQSGMILDNTELLDINDEFSIDFRKRCKEQNGVMDDLEIFSDQDITAYLTDKDYLIIFYTPLGMEVGFNYYSGWVTVTYKDYKNFIKQY